MVGARSLAFDDAPWLGGPGATAAERPPLPGGVQLCHPLLSHAVAASAGCASLRAALLGGAASSLALLGGAGEPFGQREALTTRLRHVVEAYGAGPGVLCELVQNADDAGATQVAFLLDERTHPARSLLGPALAAWQGPALLAWNDARFALSDFEAIARIGQAAKADKPAAAGRFGLGFSATAYTLTDLPQWVSGCASLARRPRSRGGVVDAGASAPCPNPFPFSSHHPALPSPYLVVLDPHAAYLPGATAAAPGLRVDFVAGRLAERFPDQAAPLSAFGCDLRRPFDGTLFRFPLRDAATAPRSEVRAVASSPGEVGRLLAAFREAAPRTLLFLNSVRTLRVHVHRAGEAQPRLLYEARLEAKGPGGDPRAAARAFVAAAPTAAALQALLGRTPDAALPRGCGEVVLSLLSGDGGPCTVQRWLVAAGVAGGRARSLALAEGAAARGLVPACAVAAPLDGPAEAGRAYATLPLPLASGLPLHAHAAWELNAARTALWHDGPRGEWNDALVAHGLAPLYAQLLAAAAATLGPCNALWRLFPPATPNHGAPAWAAALARLALVAALPLPLLPDGAGGWVAPRGTLLPDAGAPPMLLAHLRSIGLQIAGDDMPREVADALRAAGAEALTPAAARAGLRRAAAAVAAAHSAPPPPALAAALLHYCLGDDPAPAALFGLRLVPLCCGSLGALNARSSATLPLFLLAAPDAALLAHVPASHLALARCCAPDGGGWTCPPRLGELLAALAHGSATTLAPADGAAGLAAALLPGLLPDAWRGATAVRWAPPLDRAGAPAGPSWQPTEGALRALWARLRDEPQLDALADWPLLPVEPPLGADSADSGVLELRALRAAAGAAAALCAPPEVGVALRRALRRGGASLVAAGWLGSAGCHPALVARGLVAPLTVTAALSALGAGAACALATAAAEERDALRAFLLRPEHHHHSAPLTPAHAARLLRLPLWRTHGDGWAPLAGDGAATLPPPGPPLQAWLLAGAALQPSAADASVLASLGVATPPRAAFLRRAALGPDTAPALATGAGRQSRDAAFVDLLCELPALASEDAGFAAALAATPFLAGASPPNVYDPEALAGSCLAGIDAAFPPPPFDARAPLAALRSLGLRGQLDGRALLLAAGAAQVEEAAAAAQLATSPTPAGGVPRAKLLLAHLASGAADAVDADGAAGVWAALRAAPWCPLLDAPPLADQPQPAQPAPGRLAAPAHCRPACDAWLVSSACRLAATGEPLAGHKPPAALARLGWGGPPPAALLVRQMCALARRDAQLRRGARAEAEAETASGGSGAGPSLAKTAAAALRDWCDAMASAGPALLAALAAHPVAAAAAAAAALPSPPYVWAGPDAGFVSASSLVLAPPPPDEGDGGELAGAASAGATAADFDGAAPDAAASAALLYPYVVMAPAWAAPHSALLLALGASEGLTPAAAAAALRRLAAAAGPRPLSGAPLGCALALARAAASGEGDAPPGVCVPDAACVLCPAAGLLVNDAPWLVGQAGGALRLAHPQLPPAAAQRLGSGSLRASFVAATAAAGRLPCPLASSLAPALAACGDAAHCLVQDLVELADAAGATALSMLLDERQHGVESLLSPLLQTHQGPALVARIHGAQLSDADMVHMLAAPLRCGAPGEDGTPPPRVRGRPLRAGNGVLGAFAACDVLSVLSCGRLAVVDPAGCALAHPPGDPATGGVAQSFAASGDLRARFADSFAPFFAGPPLLSPGAPAASGDTLLRLPLRCGAATRLGVTFGVEECRAVLDAASQPHALLFTRTVRRLAVHRWAPGASRPEQLFAASAADEPVGGDGAAAVRALIDSDEWRRPSLSALLGRFAGISAAVPGVRRAGRVALLHSRGSERPVCDLYAVSAVLGASRARELALDRRWAAEELQPLALAAACVSRDGGPPPINGLVPGLFALTLLPGGGDALQALPLAVCAPFALQRRGGRRLHPLVGGVRSDYAGIVPAGGASLQSQPLPAALWNRALAGSAALACTELLVDMARTELPAPLRDAAFALWPRRGDSMRRPGGAAAVEFFVAPLYEALSERPLLRLARTGAAVRPVDAIFVPHCLLLRLAGGEADGAAPGGDGTSHGAAAVTWLARAGVPVVSAPPGLATEFGPRARVLAPAALRALLRGSAGVPPVAPLDAAGLAAWLELFALCLSDCVDAQPPAEPLGVPEFAQAGGAPAPTTAPPSTEAALPDAAATAAASADAAAAARAAAAIRLAELRGIAVPCGDLRLRRLPGPDPAAAPLLLLPPGAAALLRPASLGGCAHPAAAQLLRLLPADGAALLGCAPLTLRALAPLLRDALPGHMAAAAGAGPVAWDGAAPSPAWLEGVWDLVAALCALCHRATSAPLPRRWKACTSCRWYRARGRGCPAGGCCAAAPWRRCCVRLCPWARPLTYRPSRRPGPGRRCCGRCGRGPPPRRQLRRRPHPQLYPKPRPWRHCCCAWATPATTLSQPRLRSEACWPHAPSLRRVRR